MGLDTTHDCWRGSYSSFNRFRYSLARQVGINLDEYIGYGGTSKELNTIEHDLMPLFNHSDCDGELTVEESKRIVKGLNSVLENFNDDIDMDHNFKQQIRQFRYGCMMAISKNETIYFV